MGSTRTVAKKVGKRVAGTRGRTSNKNRKPANRGVRRLLRDEDRRRSHDIDFPPKACPVSI